MAGGRPPLGSELVDRLDGSDHAKQRLKLMLETLAGEKAAVLACAELGISEQAFFLRRRQWLQTALQELEPKPVGRPAQRHDERDDQIAALQRQVAELQLQLHGAQVREQVAVVMPHLLTRTESRSKKLDRRSRRRV